MLKSQSAMEYLMTYGWAILLIGIAIAVLFELGVFNISPPSASPGSCSVVRPLGPETVTGISLAGECGGLLPQYVTTFSSSEGSVTAVNTLVIDPSTERVTITGWIYPTSMTSPVLITFAAAESGVSGSLVSDFYLDVNDNGNNEADANYNYYTKIGLGDCSTSSPTNSLSLNKWYFVAGTLSASGCTVYVNGGTGLSSGYFWTGGAQSPVAEPAAYIGAYNVSVAPSNSFQGDIANVQMYNTTLSQNEITTLYYRGIGSAPIDLNHLQGWWPLNGNLNDYSGNGFNSTTSTNTLFTSNWKNGYTIP